MVKLFYILLLLIPQIGCGQTYLHNKERAEAMSKEVFFSKLWIPEKGVYIIKLYIPEVDQVVVDTIPHDVVTFDIDTIQMPVFEDPMMPDAEFFPEIETESVETGRALPAGMPDLSEKTEAPILEPSPVKIKPKPEPVLMMEDVKVLQVKSGILNTLSLKDTTYWIVINGDSKRSQVIKPIVNKEWECCWLIYEWVIELHPDDYFEIWHNDRIKDFELGDYVVARDQYFSELSEGGRIPDYYKGVFMIIEPMK